MAIKILRTFEEKTKISSIQQKIDNLTLTNKQLDSEIKNLVKVSELKWHEGCDSQLTERMKSTYELPPAFGVHGNQWVDNKVIAAYSALARDVIKGIYTSSKTVLSTENAREASFS